MTETDQNGKVAQQWPELATPRLDAAAKSARVDPKQKALLEAVASVVREGVKDLYGGRDDPKYVYIVDMLMARVRAALKKQGEADGETAEKLAAEVEELKTAAEKLPQSFKDTVGEALAKAGPATGSSDSGTAEQAMREYAESVIAALKADGETRKKEADDRVRALKEKLDLKFAESGRDKAKDLKVRTAAGAVIAKQMAKLASNQFSFKRSLTSGFKSAHKLVTSKVGALNSVISDAVVSRLKSIGRQLTMMSFGKLFSGIGGLLQTVVMAPFKLALAAVGMIWEGTKKLISWVGGGIWAGLKKFFTTPVGLFAIGYIAGYVWTKWLKPFWENNLKPAIEPFQAWLKGETSFGQALGKALKIAIFGKDVDASTGWEELLINPIKSWWDGTASPKLKELIFGDSMYERDEKGEVKRDDNGNAITRSWGDLISEKVMAGINWLLSAKLFEIPFIGGEVTLGTAIKLWAGAAAVHYAVSIASSIGKIFRGVSKIVRGGIKTIKGIVKGIKLAFKGVVKAIAGVKTSIKAIMSFIKNPMKAVKGAANAAKAVGGAVKGTGKSIGKFFGKISGKSAAKTAAKVAGKSVGKAAGKSLLKKIPVVGLLAGVGFGISRAMKGDWTGAAGELASGAASLVPGAGTALSVAIDAGLAIRDTKKALNESTETQEKVSEAVEGLAEKQAVPVKIAEPVKAPPPLVHPKLETPGEIQQISQVVQVPTAKVDLEQRNAMERVIEEMEIRAKETADEKDDDIIDFMKTEYRNGNAVVIGMLKQLLDTNMRPNQSVYVDRRPSMNPATADSYRPAIYAYPEGR